jgi:hypothetical protein
VNAAIPPHQSRAPPRAAFLNRLEEVRRDVEIAGAAGDYATLLSNKPRTGPSRRRSANVR